MARPGWMFPVPEWSGYKPVISSAYRTSSRPDHNGVDIMYRRDGKEPKQFAPGTPNGSRGYFMPDGVEACAAREGVLWSAGWTSTGYAVVVAHDGGAYASAYRHLESIAVPEVQRGEGRIPIAAGQKLGTIGYSPKDSAKLKHLHFEIWEGGGYEANTDPAPFIANAPLPLSIAWRLALLATIAGVAVAIQRLLFG